MKGALTFSAALALLCYGCSSTGSSDEKNALSAYNSPPENTTPPTVDAAPQSAATDAVDSTFGYAYSPAKMGKKTAPSQRFETAETQPVEAPHIAQSTTESTTITEEGNPSLATLFKLLDPTKPQLQVFTVKGDSATYVVGSKGAKIYIDPAKLETADGKAYSGPITVELVELQSTVDMLFAAAPTVTNGELLETGGAYYINCKTGAGEELRIKQGESLALELPHVGNDSMDLYVGQPQANGNLNWQPTTDTVTSVRNPAYYVAMDYYKRRKVRTHYDKKTREVIVEVKGYDSNEWKEERRYKLKFWRELFMVKKKLKTEFPQMAYSSTIKLDSSYTYKKLTPGSIFSKYRPKAKEISGGIKPTTRPWDIYYARSRNMTTTLRQIDNRATMRNAYLTNITGFGWINCDRLYQGAKRADIFVEIPKEGSNTYMSYILFKDIRGMLAGYPEKEGEIKFAKMPIGEVVLVVLHEQNGKIMADVNTLNFSRDTKYKPTFTAMADANELRGKIESLVR